MSEELDAAIARIKAICADKSKWKSTDINNELVEIDICETIGKAPRWSGDANDSTRYFLDRDRISHDHFLIALSHDEGSNALHKVFDVTFLIDRIL